MAIFDSLLMFRTAGQASLSATTTSSAFKIRTTPPQGIAVRMRIGSVTGTSPTLLLKAHGSNDDSTYVQCAQYVGGTITAAGEYIMPVENPTKYIKVDWTIGGTTPNFGSIECGLVPDPFRDWKRTVDFSA